MASPRRSAGARSLIAARPATKKNASPTPNSARTRTNEPRLSTARWATSATTVRTLPRMRLRATPEPVRCPADGRTHEQGGDRERPDPDADPDRVGAERPVDEPGGHRQDDAAGPEEGQDRDPQRGERRRAQAWRRCRGVVEWGHRQRVASGPAADGAQRGVERVDLDVQVERRGQAVERALDRVAQGVVEEGHGDGPGDRGHGVGGGGSRPRPGHEPGAVRELVVGRSGDDHAHGPDAPLEGRPDGLGELRPPWSGTGTAWSAAGDPVARRGVRRRAGRPCSGTPTRARRHDTPSRP